MAVITQLNALGQMRVDASHLRYIEYASVGDWDTWAGQMVSGRAPIVIRGFTINVAGIGGQASALLLNTQDSALLNYAATDSGTIYYTNLTNSPDVLSATNPNVSGTFTAGNVNYVGIDLVRGPDDSTAQSTAFLVPLLDQEIYKTVDMGITLKYKIVISLTAFGSTPNVVPIAQVTVSGQGLVTQIEDCRPMMFRLGSGSDAASATYSYGWPGSQSTRLQENPITSATVGVNPFDAVDKFIGNQKTWQDAVMSRIWEIGGGNNWYSPSTGANDVNLTIASGGGFTVSGTTISWTGLTMGYTNSTAAYNVINNGSAALTTGNVLYVTLNRAVRTTLLTPAVCNWNQLYLQGNPGVPYAIAWNINGTIYARGNPFPVGVSGAVATISSLGVVELYSNPSTNAITSATSTASNPIVPIVRNSSGYTGQVLATGLTSPSNGTLSIGTMPNDGVIQIGQSNSGSAIDIFGITNISMDTTNINAILFGVNNTDSTSPAYNTSLSLSPGNTVTNANLQVIGSSIGANITLTGGTGGGTANALQLIGNKNAWPANGTGNVITTITGSQVNAGYRTGQNPLVLSGGGTTDGTNYAGVILNTEATIGTGFSGRLVSVRNQNTEKTYFDSNGLLYYPASATIISPIFSAGAQMMATNISATTTKTQIATGNVIYTTGGVSFSTGTFLVNGNATFKVDFNGSFTVSTPVQVTLDIFNLITTTILAQTVITGAATATNYGFAMSTMFSVNSATNTQIQFRIAVGSGSATIQPNPFYATVHRVG